MAPILKCPCMRPNPTKAKFLSGPWCQATCGGLPLWESIWCHLASSNQRCSALTWQGENPKPEQWSGRQKAGEEGSLRMSTGIGKVKPKQVEESNKREGGRTTMRGTGQPKPGSRDTEANEPWILSEETSVNRSDISVTSPSNKTWADSLRAARQHASNSASPFARSLVPKHQARHAPSDQGGTSGIFWKGCQVGTAFPNFHRSWRDLEGLFQ